METTTRLSNLRRDLINTHNISKDMQMEFIHLDNDIRILKAKLKNHGVIGDVSKRPLIEFDFDGQLKALIETTDQNMKVIKCMNGYGDSIDPKDVMTAKIYDDC